MAKIIKLHVEDDCLNFYLKDKTLSLKAKGLLTQVLTFQNDSFNTIDSFNSEGSLSKNNTLKELEEVGYLQRQRITENAKFGDMIYHFSNKPIFSKEKDGE